MHSRQRILTAVATLILAATASVQAALIHLSHADLVNVSNRLMASLIRHYGEPRLATRDTRTGRVFDSLLPYTHRRDVDYRCYIFNSSEVNAEALPDGRLAVFTGLLDRMPPGQDAPLAFVFGHEISHVEHGDAERKINNALGAELGIAMVFGRAPGILQNAADALLTSGYSREVETQADMGGLALMEEAGYNTNGALTLLNILQKAEQQEGGSRVFPNHPLTADRIQNVQNYIMTHPGHGRP